MRGKYNHKIIFKKCWSNNKKSIEFINYKKPWKENNIKPRFEVRTNGANKKSGDIVFTLSIYLGYHVFLYTNWDLQKSKKTYHTDDGLKCEDTYLTNMFEDYFSSSNDFEVFLVDGDKGIGISDEEIKKRDIEVHAKW